MMQLNASMSLLIFLLFLHIAEIPAMRDWNPFDENTPSQRNPRIGYTHVVSDSNYGTGFYIWQAFMPLEGRQSFTLNEQSEHDRLSEYIRYFLNYSVRRPPTAAA